MAMPKYGRIDRRRPSGRIPPTPSLDGLVTELRVHGVGGETPQDLLDDLAPQQVGGNRLAGFYRTNDLESDTASGPMVRHVEAYSWGGLTSNSSVRVLWLVLLPFMLANVAGWMYRGPVDEHGAPTGVRFAWHRVAAGLACLALTVNAVLVGVMIAVDMLAYQTSRAGLAGRWWLWPLTWTWVRGHGERPLFIGFLVVAVVVVLVVALAMLTQSRYEAVRPPWRVDDTATGHAEPLAKPIKPPDRPRGSAADLGLGDRDFWDSLSSVGRMTWAHFGAAFGFLTVTFAITARAAAATPARDLVWWWLAMIVGVATLAFAVAVVVLDHWAKQIPLLGENFVALAPRIAGLLGFVLASVFAFRQPAMREVAGSLPGLNWITGSTYLALGVTIVAMIGVGTAGFLLHDGKPAGEGMFGGPAVTMTLAAGLLNSMLLGVLFTVGHSVGPLNSAASPSPKGIYVPSAVGWTAPALGLVLIVTVLVFAVAQVIRMVTGSGVPEDITADMDTYRETLADSWPAGTPDRDWIVGMVPATKDAERAPASDDERDQLKWAAKLRRTYWVGNIRALIGPLLWLVTGLQAAVVIVIVSVRPPIPDAWYSANGALGKATVLVATLLFLGLLWLVRSGWRNLTERKKIGMLWDVGTFWPRAFHPLAPPSYSERAVPELQRRIWRLNDHSSDVLVVAHSQGTVLAAAALLQAECRAKAGRIGLATIGSPVSRLYGWAFPGYFNTKVLDTAATLPGGAQLVRWRNFYYPTDPIGGPITGDTAPGACPCDERLLDPEFAWHVYGNDPPAPGGHSGYWTDPRVWAAIDDIAAYLR